MMQKHKNNLVHITDQDYTIKLEIEKKKIIII